MNVIIVTLNTARFEFVNVIQVSTTFVGYDEDVLKYNTTSVLYTDENSFKKKRMFRSDTIASCIVLVG